MSQWSETHSLSIQNLLSGLGFWISDLGFRVSVSGFGSQVSGFGVSHARGEGFQRAEAKACTRGRGGEGGVEPAL